jgi:RND family efflux transporter MFP subunit
MKKHNSKKHQKQQTKRSSLKVKILGTIIGITVLAGVGITVPKVLSSTDDQLTSQTTTNGINSQIKMSGSVVSNNQVSLHFKGSGKVVSLPFAEGDAVKKGDIVASLDTQDLSIALQQALNNQKSAHSALEKVLDDIHLFQYGNGGFSNVGSANETETQKQQRTAAEESAANSDEAVKAAQRSYQDAVLVSPIDGVLVQSDVTSAGVNVTPTTTFIVADPNQMVFQAIVADTDIDTIHEGDTVSIALDSNPDKPISGQVTKIYPQKVTISTTQTGYKVDVQSNELMQNGKFGSTGSVLVHAVSQAPLSVPAWTVLNNQSIWVLDSGSPKLISIKTGETRNGWTEITSPLPQGDQVITNPEALIKRNYLLL